MPRGLTKPTDHLTGGTVGKEPRVKTCMNSWVLLLGQHIMVPSQETSKLEKE